MHLFNLWGVENHGTYIWFRKSKFNVIRTVYVRLIFISALGITLFLTSTHSWFYLPRNVYWVSLLILLLLITCCKDYSADRSAWIERFHFLKLLQSKALKRHFGTTVCFPGGVGVMCFSSAAWKSARSKQVNAAISYSLGDYTLMSIAWNSSFARDLHLSSSLLLK